MTRYRPSHVGGFTLIELMIAAAFLAVAGVWVARLLSQPVAVQNMITQANAQLNVAQVADLFVNDLHEADPVSLDWTTIPQAPPATFGTNVSSVTFWSSQVNDASPDTISTTTVQYVYQPSSGLSTGSLWRSATVGTTTVHTDLLDNMESPTAAVPLIYQDTTTYHVLVITLVCQAPGLPPTSVVRRVALKG